MDQLRNRCLELYRCPPGICYSNLVEVRQLNGCLAFGLHSPLMLDPGRTSGRLLQWWAEWSPLKVCLYDRPSLARLANWQTKPE